MQRPTKNLDIFHVVYVAGSISIGLILAALKLM